MRRIIISEGGGRGKGGVFVVSELDFIFIKGKVMDVDFVWWRVGILALLFTLPHFYFHIWMVLYEAKIWKDEKSAQRIDAIIQSSVLSKKPENFQEYAFLAWNAAVSLLWIVFFVLLVIKMLIFLNNFF